MNLATKTVFMLLLLCGAACAAFAQSEQTLTGTPAFGSYGGSSVDMINLSNLNVHLTIPIINKPGRGMPFAYDLTYDSSIWEFGGNWTPVVGMGWGSAAPAGLGFITYACTYWANYGVMVTTCSGYTYIDGNGTWHYLNGAEYISVDNNASCENGTANDGSGYSYTMTTSQQEGACNVSPPYLTSPTGLTSTPLTVITGTGASGTANVVDSNGNEITLTTSSNSYTDTLGDTVLTISGSGTPSSPTNYSYTAPSGATATYTVKYTSETVRTNFGCSNIAEYGPTATNLVTEIDLPDVAVNPGDKYTFTYESTPGYSGDVTGRITSVTLPTGGTISYSYTGGSSGHITCADGSAATLLRYTPDSGADYWTYAHTENGTAWTTKVTDPASNETDIDFQGVSVNLAATGEQLAWEGFETQRSVYNGSASSGTLLETVNTCYNGAASPCNSTAIALPILRRTVYSAWPGTTNLESEVDTQFNVYGQVTQNDEYAFGNGSPGPLVRQTATSYYYLSNNFGFITKPSQVSVENATGGVVAQTSYCYDEAVPSGKMPCGASGPPTPTSGTPQHLSVTGSRGNVTTVASLLSGSTTLGKTFTYFDTGNVNVATDVNGAQTTYTYGACGNSFLTATNEPLGLSQSETWNCTGGVETSITDENGKTKSMAYTDAYFWRPSSMTDQLSNVTNITYTGQNVVESTLSVASGGTSDVRKTEDWLGRPYILQVKQSPNSSLYDSTQVQYNSDGILSDLKLPYNGTAGETNPSGPNQQSKSFDGLFRPTQIANSGGLAINITYPQNDTYRAEGPAPSGENQRIRQFEHDALGRLISVCEITAGTSAAPAGTCAQTSPVTGYWTAYTYDPDNNLTGVTQNAQSSTNQQSRRYTYDGLGRMTSETNPENFAISYTYDTDPVGTCGTTPYQGDLVKKIDQMGNVTCYSYDLLHRPTSVTYPVGPYSSITPSRYFSYDSATLSNGIVMVNAKTRMAEAYTCFSPCTTKLTDEGFSYTARGEVSDVFESTPNSGGYYHVYESYWPNGAVNQLNGTNGSLPLLPGLPTITYGVDGEGRLYSATASSGQNPLSSTTYNAASLPLQITLGSSDSDTFTYDPNSFRMNSYTFDVNGQSVVGSLTWNGIGTLGGLSITDPFNALDVQTCSYVHDDLMRIGSETNPTTTPGVNCMNGTQTVWSQSIWYDAFGNIDENGSTSFQATYSPSTNQMTLIGNSTPTYDTNGNVTNDFLNTYAWDANDRPVTVDGVSITFDALGRMVEQSSGGQYKQIAYGPDEKKLALMNGASLEKGFIPLTGGDIAIYNSNGLLEYRHSDWLGSARFGSTASTRSMYADVAYSPFGVPYSQVGTADPSFTAMNQDTASTVYDFPAREYGFQGRWPSPDPAGISAVNPMDPQTWNRYAYVRNNPLRLTDPTGDCGLPIPGYTFGFGCVGASGDDDSGQGYDMYGQPNACYVDGLSTACSVANGLLQYGAAAPCPGPGKSCDPGVYEAADGYIYFMNPNQSPIGKECQNPSAQQCIPDTEIPAGPWVSGKPGPKPPKKVILSDYLTLPVIAPPCTLENTNDASNSTSAEQNGNAEVTTKTDSYLPCGFKSVRVSTDNITSPRVPPVVIGGLLGALTPQVFGVQIK